jgi:hypothetical protein
MLGILPCLEHIRRGSGDIGVCRVLNLQHIGRGHAVGVGKLGLEFELGPQQIGRGVLGLRAWGAGTELEQGYGQSHTAGNQQISMSHLTLF